jgi:beta-galactosidase/beta-glucuronidase
VASGCSIPILRMLVPSGNGLQPAILPVTGTPSRSRTPGRFNPTFAKMGAEPDADIMENGLEQLQELISRDRNHPSVVVWGLCNEIYGQNPSAYHFAKRLLQEAKKLDPNRLCSYASNSLFETPQRDVAGLMDFVEANSTSEAGNPDHPRTWTSIWRISTPHSRTRLW